MDRTELLAFLRARLYGVEATVSSSGAPQAAVVGYVALARGARLFPATYAAIAAGVGAALVAGHLPGSH